jgi:hypothetical protein
MSFKEQISCTTVAHRAKGELSWEEGCPTWHCTCSLKKAFQHRSVLKNLEKNNDSPIHPVSETFFAYALQAALVAERKKQLAAGEGRTASTASSRKPFPTVSSSSCRNMLL